MILSVSQVSARRTGANALGVLAICLLAFAPLQAVAGDHESGHTPSAAGQDHGKSTSSADKLDPKNIEIPVVPAPLVQADGTLTGYAFVGIRVRAREPSDAEKIKEDLPEVQDAIVRAINANPVRSGLEVDRLRAQLLKRIRPAVSAAVPAEMLEAVELRDVVHSSL